jgi:hypothetical protein
MQHNQDTKLILYSLFISFALFFHVFNTIGFGPLKIFYIFVLFASISSFFVQSYEDQLYKFIIVSLILFSFIGASTSPFSDFESTISVTILLISCRKLPFINLQYIDMFSVYLLNIVCVLLLFEYRNYHGMRFHGYYNDPNYMCLTLLTFIYFNFRALLSRKYIFEKVIVFINLIMVALLVLLTQSRTGLICYGCMIVVCLKNHVIHFVKNHLIFSVILIIPLFFLLQKIIFTQFYDEFDFFVSRFDGRRYDDIKSASNTRIELSHKCISFLIDNPLYIPFGIGTGNAELVTHGHRDHNTITSCLSEQGLLSLVLFLLYLGIVFMRNYKRNDIFRHLNLIVEVTFILFSLSIWCMTYLPFWIVLSSLYNTQKTILIKKIPIK